MSPVCSKAQTAGRGVLDRKQQGDFGAEVGCDQRLRELEERNRCRREFLGSRRSKENRVRSVVGGDFSRQQPHKREEGRISYWKLEEPVAAGRRSC